MRKSSFLSFMREQYLKPSPPACIRRLCEHRPHLRTALAVCGYLLLALTPLYTLFMTEYLHFADRTRFLSFLKTRTPVVLFDLTLLYLLFAGILCLVRKGWAAVLLLNLPFGALACADYYKYAMTGDYFYPWDLNQAGNLGELSHFITVPFPPLYAVLIVLGLLWALPVFFAGADLPLRFPLRLPAAGLAALLLFFPVSSPDRITKTLNRSSLYLEDMALQTSNYRANGFLGAFCINVLSSSMQKPDGYSPQAIETLLDGCTGAPAAADFSSPDIIVILSESFWDPTLLPGTAFSADPMPNFRALAAEDNTVSGRFFTTGFGGGTVRPEFEILTGLTTDYLPSGSVPWQYLTKPTETYVSQYKNLGYRTIAVHPYTSSFYRRKDVFPLAGFDDLHFEDDIYALQNEIDVSIRGGRISDATFADAILYYMEQETEAPVFLYGISMENHQPYLDKFDTHTITAENPAFDASVANAVSNFTEGVKDADACLGTLADYVRNRERDTVLVWFGDHLPTLGADFGAYVQSGMVEAFDEADYEKLYSTPYLVYANFELHESELMHKGPGNDLPSYQILNGTAELIGAPRTPLMDFLKTYYRAIPYYNIRLHKTVTEEQQNRIDGHRMLTYDRLAGGSYSVKPSGKDPAA